MSIPGVPNNSVIVKLFGNNYRTAESNLQQLARSYAKSLIFIAPLPSLSCLVFKDWTFTAALAVVSAFFFASFWRSVRRNIDFIHIERVRMDISNADKLLNVEDIYNATLKVTEMKGFITAFQLILKVINICSLSLTFLSLALHAMKIFLKGG